MDLPDGTFFVSSRTCYGFMSDVRDQIVLSGEIVCVWFDILEKVSATSKKESLGRERTVTEIQTA